LVHSLLDRLPVPGAFAISERGDAADAGVRT
jgi:hypothetical protein